jgi:RHS repeat-associated protein
VDYLNTPRLVANQAGQTVWRWDQAEPFGNNPADEDPDANLVAFDLPLRLPGQRYDAETALHYNYFRDYDPSLGRYGESDPIGLKGGLNTYAYVGSRPLRVVDPFGLQGESGAANERCPPNACQKKCLESVFGEPVDGFDVLVDPPMVTRHLGEGARGSVTRENTVYTNLGCGGFWSQHSHVLHEYFHVIRQWGRGMTWLSYLINWRQREREADAFAQDHVMEYVKCLSMCSPQCKP